MSSIELPHGLAGRDEVPGYFDWIARLFGVALRGAVLDHGAGTGMLSERLLSSAEHVYALEPEPLLVAGLSRRFAGVDRLTVVDGPIETYLSRYGSGTLDAIISSNVIEHLADDVGCLTALRTALRPGGVLAVYVPARQELFGTLDESVGHLRRYSRSLLRARLERAGFFVQWTRYGNVAGVIPWLVMGRVLCRRAIEPRSLKLFDRYVLPLASRAEAALRVPYGLNVAALARRQ